MILAGDIGGTKTLIALYENPRGTLSRVQEEAYPSRDFPSLEDILLRFLDRTPRVAIRAACFAVAGPVIDGRCKTTNLPWELDEGHLAGTLNTGVKLLNDLEGAAYGLLSIDAQELEILQSGVKTSGECGPHRGGNGSRRGDSGAG
jgi:glucokinase